MLGILIGVTAVIWLVAMGEGVSYQAQQQIKDLGATSIIIRSIKPSEESSRDVGSRFGISYGLLRDDYDRIVTNVPTISRAVPMREISREVRHREYAIDGQAIGCTPDYFGMNRLDNRPRPGDLRGRHEGLCQCRGAGLGGCPEAVSDRGSARPGRADRY